MGPLINGTPLIYLLKPSPLAPALAAGARLTLRRSAARLRCARGRAPEKGFRGLRLLGGCIAGAWGWGSGGMWNNDEGALK